MNQICKRKRFLILSIFQVLLFFIFLSCNHPTNNRINTENPEDNITITEMMDLANEGNYEIAAFNDQVFEKHANVYKSPVPYSKSVPYLIDDQGLIIKDPITVYFPKKPGKYPLIVLTHGFMGEKGSLASHARHLATHGFVTATYTTGFASNLMARPKDWIPTFNVVFEILKNESNNTSSSIYNKIDFNKLAVVGHSMGGAASLHFTNVNKKIKAMVALNPYNGTLNNLGDIFNNEHTANTLILLGNKDGVATANLSFKFFNNLQISSQTESSICLLTLDGHQHCDSIDNDWKIAIGGYVKGETEKYRALMTAWFLAKLKPDLKSGIECTKYFNCKINKESKEFNSMKEWFKTYEYLEGITIKSVPAYICK